MVLETILVTSAAFAFSPLSIITIYSILNGNNKIEEEEKQNYNQVSIYREQFEIGYTSYIKKFLNYLLHLSHEELLISLKQTIEPQKIINFHRLIDRRSSKEPIAYILEKKEFIFIQGVLSKVYHFHLISLCIEVFLINSQDIRREIQDLFLNLY